MVQFHRNILKGEIVKLLTQGVFPGVLLAVVIAYISNFLHGLIVIDRQKPVSAVIIAIIIGLLYKNLIGKTQVIKAGIDFCLKKVLRLAIILLGLSLSFKAVILTGASSLVIILLCVTVAMVLTTLIGRKLGLKIKMATLIGVGTSICGATAIVAAAPAIKADDDEVAYSVATITIFGILAIFLYPLLGQFMNLNDSQFGTWAGVAIHETAQVVAAGFSYSEISGKIATVVKLTRTVILAPLVLILPIIFAKDERKNQVDYKKIFPWFVAAFILMAVVRTIGDGLLSNNNNWRIFLSYSHSLSKFLIVVAMAGVGLMTSIQQLKQVGIRPFVTGLAASVIMAVFSLSLILLNS